MGILTIEIPQNVTRSFQVDDAEFGSQILNELTSHALATNSPNILPPRRSDFREVLEDVVGIWADRPESAQEIARQIRRRNNGL